MEGRNGSKKVNYQVIDLMKDMRQKKLREKKNKTKHYFGISIKKDIYLIQNMFIKTYIIYIVVYV